MTLDCWLSAASEMVTILLKNGLEADAWSLSMIAFEIFYLCSPIAGHVDFDMDVWKDLFKD